MANNYHGLTRPIANVPRSAGEMVGGAAKGVGYIFYPIVHPIKTIGGIFSGGYHMVRHPIDSAKNIGGAAAWASTKDAPDVERAAKDLKFWQDKAEATPHFKENLKDATRALDRTVANQGMRDKTLFGSLKTLSHNVQIDVFGRDAAKVGSAKVIKNAEAVDKIVGEASRKAWFIERLASKPVRVAANHPRIAAGLAAVGALVGAASWIRGRDAQKTENQMMMQAGALQQQGMMMGAANDNPMAFANDNPVSYKNSVSPDLAAELAARQAAGAQEHVAKAEALRTAAAQPTR